ncbi:alpha/beta fold hydrolase [Actinoplanes sp. NPDC023936]|uniref:alpha/beta hydrolase n=1 Tax=Actinoplanes sp. NPDC023936 TaxID=3154910 RepID=UPI0033E68B3A
MGRLLLLRGALGVLIVVLVIWSLQRKLIYFPDRSAPPLAAGASAVTLRTDDGLRLEAWLVKPPLGTRERPLSVLVAHGNAGHRASRMPLASALASLGVTVLLLDYRGYGGNPGRPSEDGLRLDALAGRTFLDSLGLPIIYYGESLGAAVVTSLAVRHPPAGLVLRSPFTSLAAAGRFHYPWLPVGALLWDRYPVASQISQVKVPTVVVYGTADTVVPAAQSAEVARRAGRLTAEVVIPGADHNDRAMLDGPELLAAVETLTQAIG